jgi:plastocyanin
MQGQIPRACRLRSAAVSMALVITVVGLASCNRPKPVETLEIFIRDRKFEPAYVKANRGDNVWWINESDEKHVVSFEGFDSVEMHIDPGQRRGFVSNEVREYKVYCKIHNFKGRLLIVEPEA